ncbi:phosphoglycerate-bisphosphoglycerate mutase family M protein [Thecamonas trahens ATCC 50062]|uniref:Phosphoglycerate-bisphosphoglycerate mutase family M protein n=1 Tax=Thecamonas trahens ATCC 50062 TaxID=461836 RepID=A0A0L0DQE0_THETB|nr:phosphoglycerate-bisphosphoglycerate mutase family M protein [Thecamonas trahens ATCC 50062]KNC54241.1 phosphoglycerate-bisphosphoglycerate mutase family M protein [Thecamonas trahens ATCC 50062]|eukprot:XP_013753878.1 phosphoglycerate-bisphosphoglycerate mutase family M protein [Thecamonas trahens ATCC 50062]
MLRPLRVVQALGVGVRGVKTKINRRAAELRVKHKGLLMPERVFLVRHGESEANLDRTVYFETPDNEHALSLRGFQQAKAAGELISRYVPPGEDFMIYHSPFERALQTCAGIYAVLAQTHGEANLHVREDPRLREQEWGNYQTPSALQAIQDERANVGRFYYRFPTGESGCDVFDRVSSMLNTFVRDAFGTKRKNNVVIVSHGLTLRLFLMRFFRWNVDTFEALMNFDNGQVLLMKKAPHHGMEIMVDPPVENIFEDLLINTPLPPGATSYNSLFENGEWTSLPVIRDLARSLYGMPPDRSGRSLLGHAEPETHGDYGPDTLDIAMEVSREPDDMAGPLGPLPETDDLDRAPTEFDAIHDAIHQDVNDFDAPAFPRRKSPIRTRQAAPTRRRRPIPPITNPSPSPSPSRRIRLR